MYEGVESGESFQGYLADVGSCGILYELIDSIRKVSKDCLGGIIDEV